VIHESERTRITRLYLPDRTVVCKEPLGPDAPQRLRHERAMLERLRGVQGVAQLVDDPACPGAILLADVGGTSLGSRAKPLDFDVLVGLGSALAQAVAGMHRRGVMHHDITPANIVISWDGTPCLVDFALATLFAETRPEFAHGSEIVGTLAYLAPEQTGRTGRSVDQRADLYAFGATLYELATGAPPFGSDDPLRITHDHLARAAVPPAEENPAVPGVLSEIIMHLLEKEPDSRYQTAEGVAYDLERLRDGAAAGPVQVGKRDFPSRLLPPSRLVGRAAEVATLKRAFEDALVGRRRGVLVAGGPGVGKTALVDELRPVVAGSGGWFVAGKFDQYRRDLEFDGLHQALRALGRLLLAEPEEELRRVRERILGLLGPNAGQLTAAVPEFGTLLAVAPEPGDPLTAQARAQRNAMQVLRAVVSRQRPLVLFVDDLQWAGLGPLGFVDLVLTEGQIDGLLLVGAFRDGDIDSEMAVTPLPRSRGRAEVQHLRLENLPEAGLVTMVADVLRVDPQSAAGLVELIHPHTSGNPYETLELLNALRSDGLLTVTTAGWQWDVSSVQARLNRSEVGGLLASRVSASPSQTRAMLRAMALLGGRADKDVLLAATGEPADAVDRKLAPALHDGVLQIEAGARQAVRFRHDRIREGVLQGLAPASRRGLQLAMARRLAAVPGLFAVAAEQYVPVIDAVDDAEERQRVVHLIRRAAEEATLTGDHVLVNALLAAALQLVDPADTVTVLALRTRRQAALFSLGRLEESDEEYRAIQDLRVTALDRVDATAVQVRSLTHRTRFSEAIGLGMESLRECGIAVPPADQLPAALDHQFARLHQWLDCTDAADDLSRPDLTEPTLLAATRLIDALLPTAYFVADPSLIAWLGLEALRIWTEHGVAPTLVGPSGHAAYHAGPQRNQYATGYRALQRIVTVGEARGYEPGTSQARHMLAALSGWFEPIENGVRMAQQARDGLIAGDDLAYAGYTYQLTVPYLADCAPSLEKLAAEVDGGLDFLRRTGNEQTCQWLYSYQWLAHVLRGGSPGAAGELVPLERHAGNPLALLYSHLCHALTAAVLGDPIGLAQHSAAAMPLLPAAAGFYSTAVVRVLRGLALAEQIRGADDERSDLLQELDDTISWLAARTRDAPGNFLHLQKLVQAERAWTVGDFRAAVLAFDAAQREVAGRGRPWHQALIIERAAHFHLAHGAEHTGHNLLAQAREAYAAWGATAKTAQLDWAYPALRGGSRTTVTTGTLDLIGVLSASQALSSETSIDRLHSRVGAVLSAMTGATGVHLLLWKDDRQEWLLPVTGDGEPDHVVPTSVLRYVQRVREPLVLDDATRDDRFSRDPYFSGVDCCSFLALPVLGRGALRAVLLLENRLMRGAFTTERLDAVKLIAGQLTVSLDNAQLYAELTASRARIVAAADQTRRDLERDLHDGAQQRLVSLALQARMARSAALTGAGELAARLDALAVEATRAIVELRELARGIHPVALAKGGLGPAVKGLARRSATAVRLEMRVDGRLPEPIEIAAYYVVAEALTNAAKHAYASAVTVTLTVDGGPAEAVLRVRVSDDGRGGADLRGGSGLVGLKDRVEALGGRFSVQSAPLVGTTVHAEFPVNGGRTDAG
jgi:predicted ATPase/signal transduction histidine kinase